MLIKRISWGKIMSHELTAQKSQNKEAKPSYWCDLVKARKAQTGCAL